MCYAKVTNLWNSLSVFSVVLTIFRTSVSINSVSFVSLWIGNWYVSTSFANAAVGCIPFSNVWNYVNPKIWQSRWTEIHLGWFVIARKVDAMSLDSHKMLDFDREGNICCPVHFISFSYPQQFVWRIASEVIWVEGSRHMGMIDASKETELCSIPKQFSQH
jgi:hypothetical protein